MGITRMLIAQSWIGMCCGTKISIWKCLETYPFVWFRTFTIIRKSFTSPETFFMSCLPRVENCRFKGRGYEKRSRSTIMLLLNVEVSRSLKSDLMVCIPNLVLIHGTSKFSSKLTVNPSCILHLANINLKWGKWATRLYALNKTFIKIEAHQSSNEKSLLPLPYLLALRMPHNSIIVNFFCSQVTWRLFLTVNTPAASMLCERYWLNFSVCNLKIIYFVFWWQKFWPWPWCCNFHCELASKTGFARCISQF